jgi:prefoldin subunit 5
MKETPIIRLSIDLTPHGVKNVVVTAGSLEARDEAIERLRRCLPQLESLEAALQAEVSELDEPFRYSLQKAHQEIHRRSPRRTVQ